MKLLIITQKVDREDPVLGFFHRWIEEFSKNPPERTEYGSSVRAGFEKITVICLEKGESNLPANVKVLSLGKENNKSTNYFLLTTFYRLKYLWNFYKYIWQERKNYDVVFVHMNQEYVLLGWKLWFILRKKVYMWRNHGSGSLLTSMAVFFCKKVFCTSKYSYTAKYKKTLLMPVGVDTEFFKPNSNLSRVRNSILFLGRIAPIKRPDLLIDTLAKIKNIPWTLTIVGDPLSKDLKYYKSLKEKCHVLGIEPKVSFQKGVPNDKTPDIYATHDIFVNLSPSGMYDKTIFEAASCGCFILVSNENLRGKINERFIFKNNDEKDLIQKLSNLLDYPQNQKDQAREELRSLAEKNSLTSLVEKLSLYIK